MLLTRAPLDLPGIATRKIPYDLHVLNTPPAFVLSQNQTLRKKFGGMIPVIADRFIFQIDLMEIPRDSHRTARLQWRAAHNSIFFPFPAFLGPSAPPPGVSAAFLARPVLGHTVKELPSRGLKSRSGGLLARSTAIDVVSLGRPRSWRPAKLGPRSPTRQPILTIFSGFFPTLPNPLTLKDPQPAPSRAQSPIAVPMQEIQIATMHAVESQLVPAQACTTDGQT